MTSCAHRHMTLNLQNKIDISNVNYLSYTQLMFEFYMVIFFTLSISDAESLCIAILQVLIALPLAGCGRVR